MNSKGGLAHEHSREFKSARKAIKRLNEDKKKLIAHKNLTATYLYNYMVKHDLVKFEGITLKAVTPKPHVLKLKKHEKEQAVIELFKDQGINDPQGLWETLQEKISSKKIDIMDNVAED
jgi:hypothetical protein